MRKLLLTCLILLLGGAFYNLHAQTKDELERQRQQIQAEIEDLRRMQNQIQKNKKQGLRDLAMVQNKLRKRNALIETINKQMRLIDGDIFVNNREIYRLQRELDTLKVQYAKTIEYAYKNSSNYDMLNFLFSASSFNDAVKRVQYLKSYREYREKQVDNINRTRELLNEKNQSLEQNKNLKSRTLVAQNEQMKILEGEKQEKNKVVVALQSKEKELQKELSIKRKLDKNIRNQIAVALRRILEEERKKSAALAAKAKTSDTRSTASENTRKPTTRSSYAATPESIELSENFASNRGKLPWPVERGEVVTRFGRQEVEGLDRVITDNIGIGIATPKGQSVKAVFGGNVSAIGDIQGNWTVTLRHGKYLTTYSNLASVSVSKGETVKTGQSLGTSGENWEGEGEITFVVNVESKFVDPLQWLRRR